LIGREMVQRASGGLLGARPSAAQPEPVDLLPARFPGHRARC